MPLSREPLWSLLRRARMTQSFDSSKSVRKPVIGLPKNHSIAVRRNGRELTFPIIVLVLVVCVNRARLLPALPQDHLPPLPPGHLPPLPAQLLLDVTRSSVSTTRISSTKIVGSLIASGLPKYIWDFRSNGPQSTRNHLEVLGKVCLLEAILSIRANMGPSLSHPWPPYTTVDV